MATAPRGSLQGFCEEGICSICLDYFKDPVITECGHNFCRACLTHYWAGLVGREVFCPQCREKVRRNLIPNRQLGNFVELTKKLHLQGETSPTGGKGGACGKHQEPLKLFCKDDEVPICVVCDRSKEHRNHNVVPLEEAAQDYKHLICCHLERLEEERVKVVANRAETEEESQYLMNQTKAEMEKTKEQFRELHSFLNEQEKLLLARLEEVEKEIARKRHEHLARLSEELSSLGGLIREMEQKHQQPPGELLQDVRSIVESHEKKKTFQNPVIFPTELNSKIQDVHDRNTFLAERMKQFRDTLISGTQTSTKAQVNYKKILLQKANVTLDPDTANPRLLLSEDRKSVRDEGRRQDLPNNPERFDLCRYVLGREGFTAGRHFWEVTVGSLGGCALGVARKSIRRKGHIELKTEEGIWAVGRWDCGHKASDLPEQSFLPLDVLLRRIRVSLNYEKGQVAFHDADTGAHLYTFSGTSFSGETLSPFFSTWGVGPLIISP